jgi:5-methylcytosine-specific restriction endonuclease McrA
MGTKISVEELYERDKGMCGICGKRVTRRQLLRGLANRDHIVPASLGGTNHRTNLRLSHSSCNVRRGNDLPRGGQPPHDEVRLAVFESQKGLCVFCNEGLAFDKETEALIKNAEMAHKLCIRRDRGML